MNHLCTSFYRGFLAGGSRCGGRWRNTMWTLHCGCRAIGGTWLRVVTPAEVEDGK